MFKIRYIIKIIGKKKLSKELYQLNLMDGRNIITKDNPRVGDSVDYNFVDNKINKIINMEKGQDGFVIKGKHIGLKGKIIDIIEQIQNSDFKPNPKHRFCDYCEYFQDLG